MTVGCLRQSFSLIFAPFVYCCPQLAHCSLILPQVELGGLPPPSVEPQAQDFH